MFDGLKRLARAWRAAPATKASRTAAIVAMHGQGRPRWTPRDYEALAREGFVKNPVAYRAVRLIAESAASLPLLLFEGRRELDAHPLLDLLARPNPAQTGREFLEAVYAGLQIAGNAYIEAVNLDGVPRELHALRADRVKVVPGPNGWPSAYAYSAGGSQTEIGPEASGFMPVMHLKLFHPADDHYGLSPIEAAAQAIDLHNSSAAWNKALLDNAARPSGALVFKGPEGAPNLTEEQFGRLRSELDDSYSGARGAGRPCCWRAGSTGSRWG